MKLLSRTEEFILLSVVCLKNEAYAVKIRELMKNATGKFWSYGALFTSMEQMVKKKALDILILKNYILRAFIRKEYIMVVRRSGYGGDCLSFQKEGLILT